jgi:nucleotidyltransferase substrate binding protein (TIGR01987 family)
MHKEDVRWRQRFSNFKKSYQVLLRLLDLTKPSEGERLGSIQAFELAFELAWKTLGDYLQSLGHDVVSPRPIIKQAFQIGLIVKGEKWLEMLDNRNQTSHTYDEEMALLVYKKIKAEYLDLLQYLYETISRKIN